ncbi:hypothetical protein C731_3492 [Mycolicibacterium hassiacum DSM 44199]|jgi:hypothetical protein|uniref:Uncharacterized protein n=1 Tax=Mycolicibacterium hassiacum (strain DSM 44199 / CIP 105218 / JCM 12690 / 3849) TaxID=1122247 RepID=K5BJ53_MYCHD|nr:LpqN/LpqT family lipoprotein [Mycolicibacterium hassiacum]EKF22514.1 hypothetical protein C731_3492 [Mycolicibacterium hassiacum DSM 44199]MBX5488496.1 LpqN/LpqT family lipoprotein [Mycolicibacterium hassiacum]PZN20710.1 MAG: hypothetical protein DIU75_11820 [Mycolicibacterium hassiacum]VCT91654.1 hypothetical protein MHAS_03372 [Mycolicibacterium hassiacum DSM 44199]
MLTSARTTGALLAITAAVLTSCTEVIHYATPVAGPDRSPLTSQDEDVELAAADCAQVDAPMTTIPSLADDEPVLRIPQPRGWDRETRMDSQLVRFTMVNRRLVHDQFAPNAVMTLERAAGFEDPDVVFEAQRGALADSFGATDLRVRSHTLCGLPAETVDYLTPPMGNTAPHPATVLMVVMNTDDTTFAVTVTVQTTDPANPTYQRDAETILSGFQVLPPPES